MSLERLQTLLQSVESAAYLVEPRVLRRVIRLDRRLQGLRLLIPHESSYTIDRDRLLAFVDVDELIVSPGSFLPRRAILLPQPDEDELDDDANWPSLVDRYRRLLFHACVHLELENHMPREPFVEDWGAQRREQIGEVEFAEIREVLLKEDFLFQSPTDAEIYVEFAALFLELNYFALQELPHYFPAIRNWQAIYQILQQDLDHQRLFQQLKFSDEDGTTWTQPAEDSPAPTEVGSSPVGSSPLGKAPPAPRGPRISLAMFRQLQAKAELASAVGNGVKAALSYLKTARWAPEGEDYESEALAAAQGELSRFSQRLQKVLHLSPEEAEEWRSALQPLLAPAAEGFWSNEARLLYDLQKVCTEQERGVYRLDLVKWICTFGKCPVRRPLPLLRDALTLQHLRTARRRIAVARISPAEQTRLSTLLEGVLPRIEDSSRNRLRPIINQVFDEVGFVPNNVLETVARQKLVEELMDRIVERSYFTMADLRDAISKNDLKLTDVTSFSELAFGDCLLKADRQFDTVLDGVYRRGAVYLRWPQTLSSLAFGTKLGRLLTKHLIIPFGGAYLLLEFLRHTKATIVGKETVAAELLEIDATSEELLEMAPFVEGAAKQPDGFFLLSVLLLGTWLSLLIHRPDFRAWNVALLWRIWRALCHLVVDLPARLLNSRYVQRILASRAFAVAQSYVLEPGLLVGLIWFFSWLVGHPLGGRTVLDTYLIMALFLNSFIGRYLSERTIDLLVRAWKELKMNVFAAIVRWIMDIFDRLLVALERVVYTVDDWLRFRAGDNRIMQGIKLAGGVVWFFVSYIVVFVFTLLVEPQINPIKHFPVVTVSHKLILPTGPMFVQKLTPYLGFGKANTLVWTTIWLIPGVFGFLVWELKENWRLYAANRPRRIGSDAFGHHGETMLRLLRPGIHSGTLPKAFAVLRRLMRKGGAWEENRIQRKRIAILRVEEAVRHFVERELIALLEVVRFLPETKLSVGSIRAATNRIDVELLRDDQPEQAAMLTWEYYQGRLTGAVDPLGWMEHLGKNDRRTLIAALEALFQRTGVDRVQSSLELSAARHLTWKGAVSFWSRYEKS